MAEENVNIDVVDQVESLTIVVSEVQGPQGPQGLPSAPASDYTLGEFSDVALTSLAEGDSLFRVGAEWVNRPALTASQIAAIVAGIEGDMALLATSAALTAHTGNTSNPHSVTAAQVGAYTASTVDGLLATLAPFSGARTANVLPRWDASGRLVDSGISDDGANFYSLRNYFSFGGGTGYIGVTGFTTVQVGAFSGIHSVLSGITQSNLTASGLAIGKGTTASARPLEVLSSTQAQQRWTHTAGTHYAERQVDGAGAVLETATASKWRWAYGGLSRIALYLNSTAAFLECESGLTGGLIFVASGYKFRVSSAGLGFHGRAPAASQTLLAPLADSTTGTASTAISDVGASFSQSAINNAFASLVARITSLEAKLVATTLVTQA